MIQINLKRTIRYKAPNIELGREFWDECGELVAIGVVDNVVKQKQADGSAIKRNSALTLAFKKATGLGTRSLVASEHRFVQGGDGSFKIIKRFLGGRGIEVGPATAELRRLVRFVMLRGYTGWLGISNSTRKAIKQLTHEHLARALKARR